MLIRVLLGLLVTVSAFAAPQRSTTTAADRPSGSAQSGDFGLGLMLGEPTGLSAKFWTSRVNAIDAGLSYSFNDYLAVHGDYLWHFPRAFSPTHPGNQFVPYVGIGAVLFVDTDDDGPGRGRFDDDDGFFDRDDDDAALGARIPIGLEFLPRSIPLGFFAEIVPGIGLVPSTFGFIQGGVGGRVYL